MTAPVPPATRLGGTDPARALALVPLTVGVILLAPVPLVLLRGGGGNLSFWPLVLVLLGVGATGPLLLVISGAWAWSRRVDLRVPPVRLRIALVVGGLMSAGAPVLCCTGSFHFGPYPVFAAMILSMQACPGLVVLVAVAGLGRRDSADRVARARLGAAAVLTGLIHGAAATRWFWHATHDGEFGLDACISGLALMSAGLVLAGGCVLIRRAATAHDLGPALRRLATGCGGLTLAALGSLVSWGRGMGGNFFLQGLAGLSSQLAPPIALLVALVATNYLTRRTAALADEAPPSAG